MTLEREIMKDIEIIRSKRKTISIEIKDDLRIIVRAPLYMKEADVYRFAENKQTWIEKHLNAAKLRCEEKNPPFTAEEIRKLADEAIADIPGRVKKFAPAAGVSVGRITIRNQKSRWGSCSSKGNLNFNCLLMLCPEKVRDYVVVHELCHRKEMNHSPKFWEQVEKIMPDYREHRQWLKDEGGKIIRRL